jgi:hypothetical protein
MKVGARMAVMISRLFLIRAGRDFSDSKYPDRGRLVRVDLQAIAFALCR